MEFEYYYMNQNLDVYNTIIRDYYFQYFNFNNEDFENMNEIDSEIENINNIFVEEADLFQNQECYISM